MPWSKVNIVKFEGLNSTVAPELINDGEARDILNFRMEKVGKLVSRDGYVVGLFTDVDTAARISPTVAGMEYTTQATCYTQNAGIIGLGEFILSDKWEALDTDRIMVYVIRGIENTSFKDPDTRSASENTDEFTKRHFECYLFSPVTGAYKNNLLTDYSWTLAGGSAGPVDVVNKRGDTPQGYDDMNTQLYAPNREIPSVDDSSESDYSENDNQHWIKHYIDVEQYRHQLLISDMINGDMILEDEYNRSGNDQASRPDHELRLRPNTLQTFDIDTVELDGRFATEEENDATDDSAGVLNGMGLYGWELEEKEVKGTVDHFSDKLSNLDWLISGIDPTVPEAATRAYENISNYITNQSYTTLINLLFFPKTFDIDGTTYYADARLTDTHDYVFSNGDDGETYRDILSELKLPEDEYEDEGGKKTKDTAADVYVWDDYELSYYPSQGSTLALTGLNQDKYYLAQVDRLFDKLTSGTARTTKIQTKKNAGKYAPLGVWRYRFVWDFGDGIYSAPSAELLAPDIMWSAARDDVIYETGNTYTRPQKLADIEPVTQKSFLNGATKTSYPYTEDKLKEPPILNDDGTLTDFGKLLFDLKSELYTSTHLYGPQTTNQSLFDLLDYGTSTDKIKIGSFGCQATAYFGKQSVPLNGFIWEGACVVESETIGSALDAGDLYNTDNYVVASLGKLEIPVFQSPDLTTLNSVFDDHGRCRLAYKISGIAYLMAGGVNCWFGMPVSDSNFSTEYPGDILLNGHAATKSPHTNIQLNIITEVDGSDIEYDYDNQEDYDALNAKRTDTLFRAVKKEADRLSYTRSGLDAEAESRLILPGMAGLQLVENGDDIYARCTHRLIPPTYSAVEDTTYGYVKTHDSGTYPLPAHFYSIDNVATRIDRGVIDNMEVWLYGAGERFTGVEQLTAYFPSSLLFGAPRLGIKIANDDIPRRAKRLLIFRTLSSHSNDYDPQMYGLVEAVDLKRSDGTVTHPDTGDTITDGTVYSRLPGPTFNGDQYIYEGLYYFDDTPDNLLGYEEAPANYDGLRYALKSRFNIALNERVYYYNFIETYQPMRPRKSEYLETNEYPDNRIWNTNVFVTASTNERGYTEPETLKYKYLYLDKNGIRSQAQKNMYADVSGNTSISDTPQEVNVEGTTDNPEVVVMYFLPHAYDGSIEKLEIYRSKDDGSNYYRIGEVTIGDEGIFVDDDLPDGDVFPNTDPTVEHYESGLRWSEPYQPDWIKANNFAEYRSGDGKQGTGMESQYGNLLLFKETSMHRVAVQAKEIPLSRTDEVTPELGVVAPNACINIDNMIYFLSWKGLMRYDNNQLQKIDGKFDEELQYVMQEAGELIRDAACGYNPRYNELYLNIPMLPTDVVDGRQYDFGTTEMHDHKRELLGHVYVINLTKGYVTKFAYATTLRDVQDNSKDEWVYLREAYDPRHQIRKYYTNSLGEMRSGDIFPAAYGGIYDIDTLHDRPYMWAGIYIETPYDINNDDIELRDYDKIMSGRAMSEQLTRTAAGLTWDDYPYTTAIFPPTINAPIRNEFRSKFFTGNDETIIKRVRKVLSNMYSRGEIKMRGIVIPYEDYDERIDNLSYARTTQEFIYNPSVSSVHPLTNSFTTGTDRNVLSFVPKTPYGLYRNRNGDWMQAYDDYQGKPLRFSVEIESELRTQINAVAVYWRPIHTYLS